MLTKKELEKLMVVLRKYVDARISEILHPCVGSRDPSDTVAVLWHKFEEDYLRDYSGNATPITHAVFREFLHWLDECIQALEDDVKKYADEKIEEAVDGFKWASNLSVYKDAESGDWYISLLDQHDEVIGTSKKLPAPVVNSEDVSGIKVTYDPGSNTYMVAIKTGGVDSFQKRYVKTDGSGAYVEVDKIEQIMTDGQKIAEVVRPFNSSRLPIYAPTPFIPSQFSGNTDEKIGTYGGQAVYAQHYQPTNSGSHSVVPEGGGRKVITSLFVDIKGHIVSGTYANVNPDGTLGEDININLPTNPSTPEEDTGGSGSTPEDTTPLHIFTVYVRVKDHSDMNWSEVFRLREGEVADLTALVGKADAWIRSNGYTLDTWDNIPVNFTVSSSTPSTMTYTATIKEIVTHINPKFSIYFYNAQGQLILQNDTTDVEAHVGDRIQLLQSLKTYIRSLYNTDQHLAGYDPDRSEYMQNQLPNGKEVDLVVKALGNTVGVRIYPLN